MTQMETVNRLAVVIAPRAPYLAWAQSLQGDLTIDKLPRDDWATVYLVNGLGDRVDRTAILRRHWQAIFDEQLFSWSQDHEVWPTKRTFRMFLEWFDVRVIEMVFDLGRGILAHDD